MTSMLVNITLYFPANTNEYVKSRYSVVGLGLSVSIFILYHVTENYMRNKKKKKREKTDYDCLVFLFYSLLLLYTKNWRHDIATFSPKMWVLKSFLLKNLKEIYNITLELILILPWSKSIALTKDLTIQPWLFGIFMPVYINIKSWICHKEDLFSWLLRIFFFIFTLKWSTQITKGIWKNSSKSVFLSYYYFLKIGS